MTVPKAKRNNLRELKQLVKFSETFKEIHPQTKTADYKELRKSDS